MTLSSVTGRGSNTATASGTTLALNPSANLTVNKLVVVCCATDNYALLDGASSQHSVGDSKGNTWTKISEYTETSAGVAADGVTISMFFSIIGTQINTTDTITLTCANAVGRKAIHAFEATRSDTSLLIDYSKIGIGQNVISASLSGLTPPTQYLLIAFGGAEGNDNAKTPPSGYTELFDLRTANNAADISTHICYKLSTTSRSETATSTDWTTNFDSPMYFLVGLFEYSSTKKARVSQTGAYIEIEQKALRVSQTGAYLELVDAQLRLEQAGAYIELVDIGQIPSGDLVTGSWVNEGGATPLAPSIGELTTNDGTYVHKTGAIAGDAFKVSLSEISPSIHSSSTMSFVWRASNTGTGTVVMKAQLMEGDVVIAEDEQTLTADLTDYERVLTDEEVALIDDPDNLSLRFEVVSV